MSRRPLPRRARPVPRRAVLVVLLAAAVTVLGIAGLSDFLRHPSSTPPPVAPEEGHRADPRAEVVCDEPAGREGRQRTKPPRQPVVPVTSVELLDCPQTYDGRVVRYRGEAVGAALRRDDGAWVQLNDDFYAGPLGPLPAHRTYRGDNTGIGVFFPADLVNEIEVIGGPGSRGDILEVTAVFHRVDDSTAEVGVLRVLDGRVVRSGEPSHDPPLARRRLVAAVLVPLAVGLLVTERLVARRR